MEMKAMLKVLYLLNHAGKAGTERYVYSLIERLHNKKIKAYFAYNEEGPLVDRLRELGVEIYRIEMRNPYDLKAVREVNSLCRKLGIDLIHTQYLRENYISMLSRLLNPKVKVMYTNHFIMRNNLPLRITNRLITPLEANIIAVCNKGKDMMISNGVNDKKIHVIFNGVDPDLWGEPIKSTLREEFGIDDDTFVMLCVSRFAHDKGHGFLVNSIARLKEMTNRKFMLVLANDGPLLEQVKKQVKDMNLEDKIIFTGFRRDVKNLFFGSDVYINSSEHEALSFAIIEALAAGLPVIAADMAGNGDIINSETNCGLLVKYNDPDSMAEAMLKMMNDRELQESLKKNALKTVRERFNLDIMVDRTYNLYLKSCNQKI